MSNIPLGPANVVARIVAFTGAGGNTFFWTSGNFGTPNMVSRGEYRRAKERLEAQARRIERGLSEANADG